MKAAHLLDAILPGCGADDLRGADEDVWLRFLDGSLASPAYFAVVWL